MYHFSDPAWPFSSSSAVSNSHIPLRLDTYLGPAAVFRASQQQQQQQQRRQDLVFPYEGTGKRRKPFIGTASVAFFNRNLCTDIVRSAKAFNNHRRDLAGFSSLGNIHSLGGLWTLPGPLPHLVCRSSTRLRPGAARYHHQAHTHASFRRRLRIDWTCIWPWTLGNERTGVFLGYACCVRSRGNGSSKAGKRRSKAELGMHHIDFVFFFCFFTCFRSSHLSLLSREYPSTGVCDCVVCIGTFLPLLFSLCCLALPASHTLPSRHHNPQPQHVAFPATNFFIVTVHKIAFRTAQEEQGKICGVSQENRTRQHSLPWRVAGNGTG